MQSVTSATAVATTALANDIRLFASLELSQSKWVVTINSPGSENTLPRMARRRGPRTFAPPSIIGVDDWAWRRNHRYGTLICDLERHKTIALLPDREPATAQA